MHCIAAQLTQTAHQYALTPTIHSLNSLTVRNS